MLLVSMVFSKYLQALWGFLMLWVFCYLFRHGCLTWSCFFPSCYQSLPPFRLLETWWEWIMNLVLSWIIFFASGNPLSLPVGFCMCKLGGGEKKLCVSWYLLSLNCLYNNFFLAFQGLVCVPWWLWSFRYRKYYRNWYQETIVQSIQQFRLMVQSLTTQIYVKFPIDITGMWVARGLHM